MKLDEAIRKRINELISKEGITLTRLCLESDITPSTLFDFMKGKSNSPKIATIRKICYGLNISLQTFFEPKYFEDDGDF